MEKHIWKSSFCLTVSFSFALLHLLDALVGFFIETLAHDGLPYDWSSVEPVSGIVSFAGFYRHVTGHLQPAYLAGPDEASQTEGGHDASKALFS